MIYPGAFNERNVGAVPELAAWPGKYGLDMAKV